MEKGINVWTGLELDLGGFRPFCWLVKEKSNQLGRRRMQLAEGTDLFVINGRGAAGPWTKQLRPRGGEGAARRSGGRKGPGNIVFLDLGGQERVADVDDFRCVVTHGAADDPARDLGGGMRC